MEEVFFPTGGGREMVRGGVVWLFWRRWSGKASLRKGRLSTGVDKESELRHHVGKRVLGREEHVPRP